MKVGDKFRVKDNCQWIGQAGWVGKLHKVFDNRGYAFMNNGENFKGNDPDQPANNSEYFYYEEDIEITDTLQFLPEPEFSLEEINQAQDQMG